MIRATDITRTYGRLIAVDQLSFQVPKGVICGFLGPNGAGKSTTIRMIAGLHPPDSGEITVGGVDVATDPIGVRRQVGYLPETTPLYPELRLEEYLAFRGRLAGLGGQDLARAIDRVIEACGLGDMRRRLIQALSRGFKQRTGLAAALIADPPLLVLDEPTVGLDPAQQGAFRSLLGELAGERTVLLSSHLLSEVEATCSWLVMISAGKLIGAGSREDLLEEAGSGCILVEVPTSDAKRLSEALAQTSGIVSVTSRSNKGSSTILEVVPESGTGNHRETVGRIALQEGVALHGLRSEGTTLEQLFLDRAGPGGADWGARSEGEAG